MTSEGFEGTLSESVKWLKEENAHQEASLRKLRKFYNSLAAQGFKPLDSLQQLIEEWEQRAAILKDLIQQIESYLEKGK